VKKVKKSKWSIIKLGAVAAIAILDLLGGITGGIIQSALGIPGAAGIIMIFYGPLIYVLCGLLIQKFGAITLMMFIFSVFALPLPALGTPGFLPKILIAVIIGLVADLVFKIFREKEKIAVLIIGAISPPLFQLSIYGVSFLFGVPGIERLAKFLFSPITILGIMIVGVIGAYLGYLIYQKIENTAVVKRIQA